MITTSLPGQSVWNIVTPVRICLGKVKGSFFETAGGGGGRLIFRVDELVGDGGRGSHSAHATGAGVVYTPIEAIKFSSFRLRVSKWRAPLPVVWCGSCR